MSSQSRQRSQRKASSLATAAISLQSSDDFRGKGYGGGTNSNANDASGRNAQNRVLTIKERQQIEEEIEERKEKERASKRRKVQRRIDELERTNPRDALGSALSGSSASHSASNRNDGESFSIPNSALAAAVSRIHGNAKHKTNLDWTQPPRASPSEDHSPAASPASATIKRNPIPSSSSSGGGGTTATHPTVRRLILYRRNFHTMLDGAVQSSEFKQSPINYMSASSVAEKARLVKQESEAHRRIKKKFKRNEMKSSIMGPVEHQSALTFSRRPMFCTVCGNAGEVYCPRCGDRTCVLMSCLETHNDTRCDRPIR